METKQPDTVYLTPPVPSEAPTVSEARHTPGKWGVVETAPDRAMDYVGETFIKAANGATLASLSNYNAIERRANARLMAAAPALLAELRRQYERSYNPFEPDNQSEAYHRMGALIAAATGAAS